MLCFNQFYALVNRHNVVCRVENVKTCRVRVFKRVGRNFKRVPSAVKRHIVFVYKTCFAECAVFVCRGGNGEIINRAVENLGAYAYAIRTRKRE